VRIAPGDTYSLDVRFRPTAAGAASDMFRIEDTRGNLLATFGVTGTVIEQQPDGAAPVPPVKLDPAAETAHDDPAKVKDARDHAHHALERWADASHTALVRGNAVLMREWAKYLKYTALDGGIPPALAPDVEVLKGILGNAFGNFISDVGAAELHRLVGRAAGKAAEKMLVHGVAAILMASGPGFIVGVLIETAAGILFDQMTSDKREKLDIYQDGQDDGAGRTGDAIEAKVNELAHALVAATATSIAQRKQIASAIDRDRSTADLDRITTDLGGVAGTLDKAQPKDGPISRDLLGIWLRSRAATVGSTNADTTNPGRWRKAANDLAVSDPYHYAIGADGAPLIINRPNLFAEQCAFEWQRRGMPVPRGLLGSFARDLGITDQQLNDPTQADKLAPRFAARYDRVEYTWDQYVWDTMPAEIKDAMAQHLSKVQFGKDGRDFDLVTCTPILAVEANCCVVKKFLYQVVNRKTKQTFGMRTAPGMPKLEPVKNNDNVSMGAESEFYKPTETQRNANLYALIGALRSNGTTVAQLEPARGIELVATEFGDRYATPREQHYSGRVEPLTVFQATAVRALPSGSMAGGALPRRSPHTTIPQLEVITRSSYALIRGGNAVLVVPAGAVAMLGTTSTEPDPQQEKWNRERENEWTPHPI
jgi:hypothetical protein